MRTNRLRVLTNSERGTFGCRRRWHFLYVLGLSTGISPAPLRQGALWHQCLAAWYRSGCLLTLAEIVTAVIEPWLEARQEYNRKRPEETDVKDEDKDEVIAKVTEGMLVHYMHTFPNDLEQWEVVSVEPQVARLVMHPVTGKPIRDRVKIKGKWVSRQYCYGGAMDLLLRSKADGSHWMMEHKTTRETNLGKYVRKLHWDPQIRGYVWAARNPFNAGDIKEPIRIDGVIYNVARKKVPAVPKQIDGGALSRAKIDTTREVYLAEIERLGKDPAHYADILVSLSTKDNWFKREMYPLTDVELDKFGIDVGHHALEVIEEAKRDYHSRQTQVCTGPAAMKCPYAGICIDDGPIARRSYTVLGIRHQELTGEMAEPYAALERGIETPADYTRDFPLLNTSTESLTPANDDGTVDPYPDVT